MKRLASKPVWCWKLTDGLAAFNLAMGTMNVARVQNVRIRSRYSGKIILKWMLSK